MFRAGLKRARALHAACRCGEVHEVAASNAVGNGFDGVHRSRGGRVDVQRELKNSKKAREIENWDMGAFFRQCCVRVRACFVLH